MGGSVEYPGPSTSARKPESVTRGATALQTISSRSESTRPCTPGDPGSYLAELRTLTPPLIEAHWKQQVENRGKTEHDDPSKVHALSELERIGNASKRETDAVFGQYKKGASLKADTKTSRGNIHDLWGAAARRLAERARADAGRDPQSVERRPSCSA